MEVCVQPRACRNLSPEKDRSVLALLPEMMCCGQDLHQCTSTRYACCHGHKMKEPRNNRKTTDGAVRTPISTVYSTRGRVPKPQMCIVDINYCAVSCINTHLREFCGMSQGRGWLQCEVLQSNIHLTTVK